MLEYMYTYIYPIKYQLSYLDLGDLTESARLQKLNWIIYMIRTVGLMKELLINESN